VHQFITSLGIFLKGSVNMRPSLRARDWNTMIVAPCVAAQIQPGAHTTIIRTARGQIVNIDPSLGWSHPWFVTPAGWKSDGFHFRVRPGFVNGRAPLVPEAIPFVEGDTVKMVNLTLLDGPEIRVPAWRQIDGTDEQIPAFFQRLGVRPAPAGFVIGEAGVQVDTTQRETDTPPRLLAACDVWVSVARATFRPQIDITDATGVTGQVVDYNVTWDVRELEREGTAPRLNIGRFVPVRQPTLADRLLGTFTDEGEDRILISTLYMVSPENITDPTPTPEWKFFRANNVFWNLSHAARNIPPRTNPPPLRIFTGLLGGVGDIIGNQILSQVNEISDRVRNAVNATTNEGKFWTA
jgi:hypothetical protein